MNLAITEPLHAYYPTARISNFGDVHLSSEYPVPDINGHRVYCCNIQGTHTGTHQSDAYYGWLGQVCTYRLPEGVTSFPKTPYNGLLYNTNSMKSARLSNPTPLIGWIAFPSFQENNSVTYYNSPYFFENLFHLLLSGSDDVLYWNPAFPWGPADSVHLLEAKQISTALEKFDSFWSTSPPHSSFFYPADTIAAWNAPFVLTGMRSDSAMVWRLSPRLDSISEKPEDFLVPSTDSLRFLIHGVPLAFPPNAYITPDDSALSDAGLWIVWRLPVTTNTTLPGSLPRLSIYPNPATDEWNLHSDSAWEELTLMHVSGREIRSFRYGERLSVSGLEPGMYMVVVRWNERLKTRHILIKTGN